MVNTTKYRKTIFIHLTKIIKKYIISLTDIDPKTRDKNPIESEDRNITNSQRQALDKEQQMANIIKSK